MEKSISNIRYVWEIAAGFGFFSAFISFLVGNWPGVTMGLGLYGIGIWMGIGPRRIDPTQGVLNVNWIMRILLLGGGAALFIAGAVWYPFFR